MPEYESNPTWSRDTKRIVVVVGLITVVLLVIISRPVLPLLVWSAIVAYIFQPLVGRLERWRVPRGIGAGLSLLLLALLIALAPVLLIPVIIEQVQLFQAFLPTLGARIAEWWQTLLTRYGTVQVLGFELELAAWVQQLNDSLVDSVGAVQLPSLDQVLSNITEGLQTASGLVGTATGIATGVVSAVFSAVVAFILLLAFIYYLTKDAPHLRAWFVSLLPAAHGSQMHRLMDQISGTWAAFFRGQLLLSLTIAVITSVALSVVGTPSPLVLGIIAGVLEIVPTLGPFLAMIPAVILALVQGSTVFVAMPNWLFALIVVGIYIVIQQLENVLLVPRIMGQSLKLHPMLVLVGIYVGASVAGLMGAFLAAPVMASLRLIGQYAHAKLLDRDPFPPQATVEAPKLGPISYAAKWMAAGRPARKPKSPVETPDDRTSDA